MAYHWGAGANCGGGYGQVIAADDHHVALIGDMWGAGRSDDGAMTWRPANQGAPSIPSGRAIAMSKRPATAGWAYVGIGVSHGSTPGSGYFGVLSPEGRISVVDRSPHGFGLNIDNANGTVPRPAGSTIVVDYDAATDREYIYAFAPTGITRYVNDATHKLGSSTLSPVRISTIKQCWKATVLLDSNTILAATYFKTSDGLTQSPRLYRIGNLRSGVASVTQVMMPTGLGPNALRKIGDKVYAACSQGFYRIDAPLGSLVWTKLGGTFFNRSQGSASCVMDVCGYGQTLFVGQADGNDSLPLGHAVARSIDGGLTWKWVGGTVSTNLYGTNERFWLSTTYPDGGLQGKRMDVNQMVMAGSTVLVAGRKGVWASPDEGATWYPAVKGIGGSVVNNISVLSGGVVNCDDVDWKASSSTDHFKTCKIAAPVNYDAPSKKASVGGHNYEVVDGNPVDVRRDGVSIADDAFRGWAIWSNISDIEVDQDGYVYVASSGGGTYVGTPA